jgi:hypothetical protein
MAGYLGRCLELPIPSFGMVTIPADLVRYSARHDMTELGQGVGFGSQLVHNADELSYSFAGKIDSSLSARILFFDWWIHNSDRTLSPEGGNVNLLWTHSDSRLHVIDHNVAFDGADMTGFWDEHVFRSSKDQWTQNFAQMMEPVLWKALAGLKTEWQAMPEDWTEMDTGITLDSLTGLLSRFEKDADSFWKRK